MINEAVISICAIGFAIALAAHDEPCVTYMENNVKAEDWQMDRFHRYNVWAKFFACLGLSFIGVNVQITWHCFFTVFTNGVLAALWIWLVFDPALSIIRPGRNWDYIGQNDDDGKRWLKWFGKNAGEYKAIILLLLIITTIILKQIFQL